MPVPVTVTNPSGAGLTVAVSAQLATEGPFERMKRMAQEASAASVAAPAPESGDVPSTNACAAPSHQAPVSQVNGSEPSLAVHNLAFSYPGLDGRPIAGRPPLVHDLSFSLQPGSRCLLLGANGAGKTTLLKILGGKHMVPESAVRVLGRPPFHDTALTSSGDLSYVGGTWQRDVAFAGYSMPLAGDFPASRMLDAVPNADPKRKERLIKVLDIDPTWRMHTVSDGQRRRVQIAVGLLRPFKVLLLDEITVDLDVLGRADLMRFLQDECTQRGATIIYATHIFDGLEFWPTHLAYLSQGSMQLMKPAAEVSELREGRLLELVERLLREDLKQQVARRGPRPLEWDPSREGIVDVSFSYAFNNGWAPGTLSTSLAGSSNAVMRM